ncbi:Crp-like helix-turn-helix domain-containing protein [Paenibacillus sp. yr247]|uniref:Crp/Fnr family transcriptional regulator n=1 Tax=Paenibacillus sp. yr247 TaxID=1761880 RepID=UPI000884CD12|nr:Crp/Fnr family transcriptional regulator [Paenibacillus sp. yr247]SDO24109.1 Crp-like helix-turn-helix domain-containing protein [Paenibacillus sp. yr247]
MTKIESANNSSVTSWLESLPFHWHPLPQLGQKLVLKKHDFIFLENQPNDFVYLVLNGRIRLYITSLNGVEKTIAIIGKNGMIGENGIFDNDTSYNHSAITASKATLIRVDRKKLEETLKSNFELTRQILLLVNLKMRIMSSQLLQLSSYSAIQRISHTLLQLVDTYGFRKGEKEIIGISFTHQELANLVSTSRVTTANTLKNLERSGVISKQNGKYVIEDKTRLISLGTNHN